MITLQKLFEFKLERIDADRSDRRWLWSRLVSGRGS